jgi:hypothetical protein
MVTNLKSSIFCLFSKKLFHQIFEGSCVHICAFKDKFVDYIYWKTAVPQRECKFYAEKVIILFFSKEI